MWHIAKSKASQSHTQHNLYVTDNREIVCSQNIIYQYLLLPSHWTQNFPSTLSLHPFVPFLLNSSHATRITVQSNWSFLLLFFKSSLFFSQNVTDTQTIDHFQPKRQQQSLRPKTNYYLNMFKYWIMMKNEQRLHRKARTLL